MPRRVVKCCKSEAKSSGAWSEWNLSAGWCCLDGWDVVGDDVGHDLG